ncbi:hypothetical protein GCM10010451_38260 [Streptomyces virens]|uniref:Uncharacterized protein n=1 Tax=Streptomyces virens TaxID=285572 RepID=A0ABP6PPI9_9ACTN|nr:hypothetical protein [Streptomyces calvus]MBA8980262.1 hypothetical protein [Streptomyces calvus]MYS30893.1 hypothetical protein [Streptomyces sp. SID7804]
MTRHHAVEIVLTRPVTHGELRRVRRGLPLAANADRTRLMALQHAHSPDGALRLLRRRLGSRLPVDILTTHYPDHQGQVLLNVALERTAAADLRQAAALSGQRPQDVLAQRVTAALARHERDRLRLLEARLDDLLAHHTPEDVLACTASALLHRQHHRPPTAP